ncbi:hypothetical protein GOP47_0016719 [Adiantum capillus-veneris]|uniref:Uncharacterized protein n=1 Tax=Adiantum capillus-veneris TaxID=13818 RepID=A0A9D4UI79_ADICA|nr:hypothetical protein GOP47_0016719 [Adiantum capillus-veneris]
MELAALSAVKAGVFVVQAAGNAGPLPGSVASFSPWIFTFGAAFHNRSYHNSILLSNHQSIRGFGLSPGTKGTAFYNLVLASDSARKQRHRHRSSFKPNAHETHANTCQDPSMLHEDMVKGHILVCRYSTEFLTGKASLRGVIATARKLHASGVIVVVDKDTADTDIEPFPSTIPIVLIPGLEESLMLLSYFTTKSNLTVEARIMGGLSPTYDKRAPQVAFYSSRGPDLANRRLMVAEVMKPNVMAPGDMIWAAWSPIGNDDDYFTGKNFALGSGTSMAAPHVAGIAALVKQKNPNMSPAAIGSALTTSASTVDHQGFPLLAQQPSYNLTLPLGPASPFDFGGGEVNPTAAIDPGLVFDADFPDYVQFLCSIQGGEMEVMKATRTICNQAGGVSELQLNQPSVTISNLSGPRVVRRRASGVARHEETYRVSTEQPEGVVVSVYPTVFKLRKGSSDCRKRHGHAGPRRCRLYTRRQQSVELVITITPTSASSRPSFGSILLSGSRGHVVRLPLSIVSRSVTVN